MVRQFNLVDENKNRFSLMDIYEGCLLTAPAGLGYAYESNFEKLGNIFIESMRKLSQGKISGELNFLKYENYTNLVNFIENAEELKLEYTIPYDEFQTYYRDVRINSISKSEIQPNGIMSEGVDFDCLGLWYQEQEEDYGFGSQDIVWDFVWNPFFGDYKTRSTIFNNDGHVEAPFKVQIADYVKNPKIEVIHDNKTINSITFDFTLQVGEKLEYSSKENDLYIRRIEKDGSVTNLFNSQYIDINNQNIFTLPKGESIVVVSADTEIFDGYVDIYKRFKVV